VFQGQGPLARASLFGCLGAGVSEKTGELAQQVLKHRHSNPGKSIVGYDAVCQRGLIEFASELGVVERRDA
jgi:hypothetical protein